MASLHGAESTATTIVLRPDAPHLPKQYKEKRFKHNWRLDMLAVPKGKGQTEVLELFKMSALEREAYLNENYNAMKPEETGPKISLAKQRKLVKQKKERKQRMNNLSIFPKRYYKIQKKTYTYLLGNKFEKRMNTHIKDAHESIYNEYERARIELKKRQMLKLKTQPSKSSMKKGKGGKKGKAAKGTASGSSVKSRKEMTHEQKLDQAIKWCIVNAKPKRFFPPPKINRGKIADLNVIGPRMLQLAIPMHMRHSKDSLLLENITRLHNAIRYKPTERMIELAHPNPHKLKNPKELVPGKVAKGALKAVASPRVLELAVPKARSASKDADFNEDAFTISPAAKKYVATQRILDLARPIER